MGVARGSLIGNWNIIYSLGLDLDTTALAKFIRKFAKDVTNGTGDYQINGLYLKRHTIAASSSVTLDLNGSASMVDPFNTQLNWTKIRGMWFSTIAGNTHDVEIGGAAANAFKGPFKDVTDKMVLGPDSHQDWLNPKTGWPVTAGTADQFLIANAGAVTPVTVDVALIGNV